MSKSELTTYLGVADTALAAGVDICKEKKEEKDIDGMLACVLLMANEIFDFHKKLCEYLLEEE